MKASTQSLAAPTSTLPRRCKQKGWSLAFVAALFVLLIGGVFLRNMLRQTPVTHRNNNIVSCVAVTTQPAPFSFTSCASSQDLHFATTDIVIVTVYVSPQSSYIGKGNLLAVMANESSLANSATGQTVMFGPPAPAFGSRGHYASGKYRVKVYWTPLTNVSDLEPTTPQDFARGQWSLQTVSATFDIA